MYDYVTRQDVTTSNLTDRKACSRLCPCMGIFVAMTGITRICEVGKNRPNTIDLFDTISISWSRNDYHLKFAKIMQMTRQYISLYPDMKNGMYYVRNNYYYIVTMKPFLYRGLFYLLKLWFLASSRDFFLCVILMWLHLNDCTHAQEWTLVYMAKTDMS